MSTEMLSLRVMRLNRPLFIKQQCEPAELYLDDIAGCLTTADAGIRADLDGAPMHRLPIDSCPSTIQTDGSAGKSSAQDLVRVKVGGPGELMSLPQSFGSTYLGETFSAHVNLHNESNQICYNVELKVALHNRVEWITLSTTGTLTGASIPALSSCSPEIAPRATTGSVDLHPGQSLNAVIHYELKELGVHTLRCTASYSLNVQSAASNSQSNAAGVKIGGGSHTEQSGFEPYTFQRLYKFPVSKPLDVKKKFSSVDLDGTVFMEAQVKNLTSSPIFLERVTFEPSPHLSVIDLNSTDHRQNSASKSQPVCLRPDDIRQFLFRLTPTASLLQMHTTNSAASDGTAKTNHLRPLGPQPIQTIQQPPISAGRLDITWRETMGERGRLQTSSLKYEIPSAADVQVKTTEVPSTVIIEQPFEIRIELANRSANALELLLDLDTLGITPEQRDRPTSVDGTEDKPSNGVLTPTRWPNAPSLPPLIWTGLTTRKLGSLSPGQTMPLTLQLLPTATGWQAITGLLIHELTMDRDYEFNELGHVLVCGA